MPDAIVPAFVRGETIESPLLEFGGRSGEATFRAPDPASLLGRLPLDDPGQLAELYALAFDEIVDYLAELGNRLSLDDNRFLQQALEHVVPFSDMTGPLVRSSYEQLASVFAPETVREAAEQTIGLRFLDGWSTIRMRDGRVAAVRAFGARTVHIVAGNSPLISAATIMRNAVLRSDAIIKAPSNDPFTALAIAQTMADIAPDHPITRHLSVVYWKGGDTTFEEQLYQPANVEKIVAWGGLASVRHVTRYIQPGLELISMDPKRSATVIGPEAFASEETLDEVAMRSAADIGAINQLGCVNARVVYVASGTDAQGLERANDLGERIYTQIQRLPTAISTPAKQFDPTLRGEIRALQSAGEWYRVFGGNADEGAVIVSQISEPVDFHPTLSGRVANVVPIDDVSDALRAVNAYTQTVGIYPESLKRDLRDVLPLYGAQRLVSLGYAASATYALPHDAIEPVRRMVKWIVEETCDPADVPPLWLAASAAAT
jgi:hypothetical protein